TLDMPVHDVGDRYVRVKIVDHEGAPGAAPERDTTARQAVAVEAIDQRAAEGVSHAPSHSKTEDEVGAVRLQLEDPLATGCGQQAHVADSAATRQDLLHQSDRAGIAMPVAATQFAAASGERPGVFRVDIRVEKDAIGDRVSARARSGRGGRN